MQGHGETPEHDQMQLPCHPFSPPSVQLLTSRADRLASFWNQSLQTHPASASNALLVQREELPSWFSEVPPVLSARDEPLTNCPPLMSQQPLRGVALNATLPAEVQAFR